MQLIDTHCHLYLEEFEKEQPEVMNRAMNAGIFRFCLPNIDQHSIPAMIRLEQAYPDHCYAMMGLHPCSVRENWENELEQIHSWLQKRKFIAVGEIGLDYYWDLTFKDQQIEAFKIQIEWALEFGIPIVIHSRDSMDDCIEIVESYQSRNLKGVFHCFSGSLGQARRILNTGFYLGIGGVLTYRKSGLDQVLKEIDLEHIVLETDAPYLSPVPMRGKRNESSYLIYVLNKISEIKELSPEEVARITTANAENLFRF